MSQQGTCRFGRLVAVDETKNSCQFYISDLRNQVLNKYYFIEQLFSDLEGPVLDSSFGKVGCL